MLHWWLDSSTGVHTPTPTSPWELMANSVVQNQFSAWSTTLSEKSWKSINGLDPSNSIFNSRGYGGGISDTQLIFSPDCSIVNIWHSYLTLLLSTRHQILWIHFKIREGNKCDLCDPLQGRIYLLSQLSQLLALLVSLRGGSLPEISNKPPPGHFSWVDQCHFGPMGTTFAHFGHVFICRPGRMPFLRPKCWHWILAVYLSHKRFNLSGKCLGLQ